MNTIDTKKMPQGQVDPIDDYLECVTYCSISSSAEENDCQTICMERHLKSSYFQTFYQKNKPDKITALSILQKIFEFKTQTKVLYTLSYTANNNGRKAYK